MKIWLGYFLGAAVSCVLIAAPAQARRVAIDQIPNPVPDDPDNPDESYRPFIPVTTYLSGYCDLDGEDCGVTDLGYSISFDGGKTTTRFAGLTGNGLLTFGRAVDFSSSVDPDGRSLRNVIEDATFGDPPAYGRYPGLVDYGLNLVSAGPNYNLDGNVFLQSASDLQVTNGVIKAEWFVCGSPLSCRQNPTTLTLTPTATGFRGVFDFDKRVPPADVGYVVNGQQQLVQGNSFFLPATITGLTTAVPEPASWALMIGGFGLVGGTLRRRSPRPQAALA